MALLTMYPAKRGSPQTTLAANLAADATSMVLFDSSVLPEAPNIAVIGSDENCEIVSYTAINSTTNTVSGLIRGIGGSTPTAWVSGTGVARNISSYDHDTFKANITTLDDGKANTADLGSMAFVDTPSGNASYLRKTNEWVTAASLFYSAEVMRNILCSSFSTSVDYSIGDYVIYGANGNTDAKLWRFKTAHPAGAWNASHVEQVQTMTEVQKKNLYFTNQSTSTTSTASSEFCRITDSKIDANTVVLECTFTVPSAITSDVTWESGTGYISLKGICTSTNCKVNVVLGQKGN